MTDRQCFRDTQCLHVGTDCDYWEGSSEHPEHSGLCIAEPVDALNYPSDGVMFFGAKFRNLYRPNIHVVFENSWEDVFNMESDWIWGYTSYDLNGWNGMVTAELRDGDTVKETITTYSGSGPIGKVLNFKKVGGECEVGKTIRVMCDMWNSGTANGNFKIQLINSDTGEELGIGGGLLNPGGMMGTAFDVPMPSTPQTMNLRFNVILLLGGTETLHDYATMNLVVVKPETCEHGEHKYDYCSDGTRVDTDVCIPPDWYDTQSDCEKCTVSGGRSKVCAEATGDLPAGTEITTHRCVDGHWVEVARCHEDAECWGEGDEKKVTCADGTEIVTHTCVNWEWVPTGNHCPGEGGGSPCVAGQIQSITCDDGTEIITHTCQDNKWVPTNNHCPEPPEPDTKKSNILTYIAIIIAISKLYTTLRK